MLRTKRSAVQKKNGEPKLCVRLFTTLIYHFYAKLNKSLRLPLALDERCTYQNFHKSQQILYFFSLQI